MSTIVIPNIKKFLGRPRIKGLLLAILCIIILLGFQTLTSSSNATEKLPPLPKGQHWELIWSDEFEGKELDENKWERLGNWPRRAGYWDQSTVFLDEQGHLIIETRRDDQGRYLTGGIRSQGKFEHTYGYYEIRCRFPQKEGHWSDFWLFARPSQFGNGDVHRVGNEGRDGTEVDIFEFQPGEHKDEMRHAINWDAQANYGQDHLTTYKTKRFRKGFYVIGLNWQPEIYDFYVQGQKVWSTSEGGVAQVPHFIKVSNEVFSPSLSFTSDNLIVDYIRVYVSVLSS